MGEDVAGRYELVDILDSGRPGGRRVRVTTNEWEGNVLCDA